MNKRLFFLLSLALVLAVSGGAALAQGGDVPARPVITMINAEDSVFAGTPGAYCWLQAVNDVRCEPDPFRLEPAEYVPVNAGDSLLFSIETETGTPTAFYAELLDAEDADGDPLLVDFGTIEEAEFLADLDPGQHRVRVVAEYELEAVPGDNSFVTYLFGLEVAAGGSAANVTPRPSATPRPATAAAATSIPSVTSTANTPVNTVLPPTSAVTVITEPTDPAATGAAMPTQPVLDAPPAATPTTAMSGGPAGAGPQAPEVAIVNGGMRFIPSGVEYCYTERGSDICIYQPATARSRRLLVSSGTTVRIDAGTAPIVMRIALWDSNLRQQFSEDVIYGTSISLYTFSGAPMNYTLVIVAQWPDSSSATYYFRAQIVD